MLNLETSHLHARFGSLSFLAASGQINPSVVTIGHLYKVSQPCNLYSNLKIHSTYLYIYKHVSDLQSLQYLTSSLSYFTTFITDKNMYQVWWLVTYIQGLAVFPSWQLLVRLTSVLQPLDTCIRWVSLIAYVVIWNRTWLIYTFINMCQTCSPCNIWQAICQV